MNNGDIVRVRRSALPKGVLNYFSVFSEVPIYGRPLPKEGKFYGRDVAVVLGSQEQTTVIRSTTFLKVLTSSGQIGWIEQHLLEKIMCNPYLF